MDTAAGKAQNVCVDIHNNALDTLGIAARNRAAQPHAPQIL